MENFTEPKFPFPEEPTYPSLNLGRLALINGPLLGLVALLLVAASQEEGYLGGLLQLMAVGALMGLGALLNLVLLSTTKGSRVGYLIMSVLYGAVFFFFAYEFSHMGSLKPGG